MGTLKEEVAFFSRVYGTVQKNVASTLEFETRALRDRIAAKSPVLTGRYKSSWRLNKTRGRGADIIANSSIFNPSRQASAIEFGIDPAEFPNHPWVVSYIKGATSGVDAKDGMIWSSKAIGGTMAQEFTKAYKTKLAGLLADATLEAFRCQVEKVV